MWRRLGIGFLLLVFSAAVGARGAETPVAQIREADLAGVCVHLGCGDGTLTAELAQCGNLLVHALEADDNLVLAARRRLAERGLYGQAAVEHWTAASLPYADNLVNVLVAEDPRGVGDKEILRVLAPHGTAWVRHGKEWKALQKPWPRELDEWTHWRHGPDGNMVSADAALEVPTGLRWVAGPPQDEGGKKWYYDHLLVSSAGRNFYVFDTTVIARDSFNGRLLWSADIKTPAFKEASVGGPRMSRVRPVASGDRLFCVADGNLVALDAATGSQRQVYGPVDAPREILFANGILLISGKSSLRAYSDDARLLWEARGDVKRMVAGDGRVFCLAGSQVACAELRTGKERWRVDEAAALRAATCSYGEGVLALERSSWKDDGKGSGLVVLSGDDGRRLWAKDYIPGMTHYKEARAFFARGLLWLQLEKGKLGGFDPGTGKARKEWTSCGGHCAAPVATQRFFIAPEMEFTDLESGLRARARMTRSACRNPFIPANGLLYLFPVQCECFPMLRGYMALAHAALPAVKDVGRLVKGPAYGRRAGALKPGASDEWPMYRHDGLRSGSTPAQVPAAGLGRLWQTQLAAPRDGLLAADWKGNPFSKGPLTQPVAAGGLVLAAVPDAHLLVALDARTGARRWSFIAGGRLDTPPSVCGDLCLFGAHDGRVYCVGLADGELVWQFRAAPEERRIMTYGQMESPWPVPGSILLDNGVAYFAAGRHPASDGGVHAFALHARTGEVLWCKQVTDIGVKAWYGGVLPKSKIKIGVDYEPVDMFVKDGDAVAMSRWRFKPDTGDFALDTSNVCYEPYPALKVPRGLWSYGIRQTKMVQTRPPAAFNASGVKTAAKGDTALILAGDTIITAALDGTLTVAGQSLKLDAPAIHDGIIAAYGCVYVAAADGRILCFGKQ